jgi:hypothetical protein
MPPKTRHESGTTLGDIVGPGEPMSHSELPTTRAVLRHGIYLQEMKLLQEDVDRRNYPVTDLLKAICEEVTAIWQRANAELKPPVTITTKSIERKIQVDVQNCA